MSIKSGINDLVARTRTKTGARGVFDQYVEGAQANQNAVDLIEGWTCALPPEADATAGTGAFYVDGRVEWAIAKNGGVAGARVLEIGPLEGSHTYMLERAGAQVLAVEANKLAYMKCLIVKEVLGLQAGFKLAEANRWLAQDGGRYDMVFACGVLYHMRDPFAFLEAVAARADTVFLWTHYIHPEQIRILEASKTYRPIEVERLGQRFVTYPRSYRKAWRNSSFCGGIADNPRWLRREDILRALEALGFNELDTAHEQADDIDTPAFSVFAQRRPA